MSIIQNIYKNKVNEVGTRIIIIGRTVPSIRGMHMHKRTHIIFQKISICVLILIDFNKRLLYENSSSDLKQ